jgi:hypothetical protein
MHDLCAATCLALHRHTACSSSVLSRGSIGGNVHVAGAGRKQEPVNVVEEWKK